MSQPIKFVDSTAGSTYTKIDFGFRALRNIIISADKANTADLNISFDGSTLEGTIERGEPLNLVNKKADHIYIKSASGTQGFRLWAY